MLTNSRAKPGPKPKGGLSNDARQIPYRTIELWRRWRRAGATFDQIASSTGRALSTIWKWTNDVVPERRANVDFEEFLRQEQAEDDSNSTADVALTPQPPSHHSGQSQVSKSVHGGASVPVAGVQEGSGNQLSASTDKTQITQQAETQARPRQEYYENLAVALRYKRLIARMEQEPQHTEPAEGLDMKLRKAVEDALLTRVSLAILTPALRRFANSGESSNTSLSQPSRPSLMTPEQKLAAATEYAKYLAAMGKTPDEIQRRIILRFIIQPTVA